MNIATIAGISAALAALSGLTYQIWLCHRPASLVKTVLKTLSVALLAVVALLIEAPIWLVCALALCAVGDFFLSRDGGRNFLTGLIAFAAGHVFYIVTFWLEPYHDPSLMFEIPWILATFSLVGLCLFMGKTLWKPSASLRIPVVIYSVIIAVMGLAAIGLNAQGQSIVFMGAVLFIFSDVILAVEMFLMKPDHPLRAIALRFIWMFYWMGQAAILLGISLF